ERVKAIFNCLLNNAHRVFVSHLDTDEKVIDYLKKYPCVLTGTDQYGYSLFNTIFRETYLTYQRKLHLYNFLTKQLHLKPFGRSLLCSVLESTRIAEEHKDKSHGCGCCIHSDEGYNYEMVIDDLIAQGYNIH